MLLLILCIVCNVLLAVIFKYFAKYGVNNLNAIVINYLVCVISSSIFLGEVSIPDAFWTKPWFSYSVILSGMFIVGFNVMALSFQRAGVALTAIIQKMSMVMPAAFAIAFFGESLTLLKILGMIAAVVTIVLVNWPSKVEERINWKSWVIILPLLTFVMSGIIEIVLYYVEAAGLLAGEGMQFTATSFGLAGAVGAIYALIEMLRGKNKFQTKDLIGGVVLGLPNYLTIYLLVALLAQGWDGSVLFPVNSISILLLTTLVGATVYAEQLNRLKIIGLLVGVAAILFISLS